MGFLVLFLFTLPIFSSFLMAFARQWTARVILVGQVALSIAGSAALFSFGEGDLSPPVSFMNEPVYFSVHHTPLLIYICLLFVLGFLIFVYSRRGDNFLTKFQAGLICLSLSFGFIAFISGQFMVRYVALDIVGLLVAASLIDSFADEGSMRDFKSTFIVLRLGDLFLLAAILLLQFHSQTLDIAAMIARAAELPVGISVWAFVCFLLAVSVKSGVPPFDRWVQKAQNRRRPVLFWLSGFLMPALGYYLLYRVLPIREGEPLLQWITFAFGAASLLLNYLAGGPRSAGASFARTSGFYSALLMCVVAFATPDLLEWYFVGLLLIRLLLLVYQDDVPVLRVLRWAFPSAVNLIFILLNLSTMLPGTLAAWGALSAVVLLLDWRMSRWPQVDGTVGRNAAGTSIDNGDRVDMVSAVERAAGWVNRSFESAILAEGFEKAKSGLLRLAGWLADNIENRFDPVMAWLGEKLMRTSAMERSYDRGIDWIGEKFMGLARGAFVEVEIRPTERSAEAVDEALHSLTDYEDRTSNRSFRRDLIWIPLFLMVVLLFMMVIARG